MAFMYRIDVVLFLTPVFPLYASAIIPTETLKKTVDQVIEVLKDRNCSQQFSF